MDKNYYEILEINQNASPEIVEKAYKTLAKKYHPDLQQNDFKKESEEKLKLINEAYAVLSDMEKREAYDMHLIKITPNIDELLNENAYLKNELNSLKQHFNTSSFDSPKQQADINEFKYNEQINQAKQKAYHDAYIQDLKNRGYKIRYKKTFKDYWNSFVALFVTFLILFLLWQIPFVRNIFVSMYEENSFVKPIVDMIIGLFNFS